MEHQHDTPATVANQRDIIKDVKQHLRRRKQDVFHKFRRHLLIGVNAIQALRMLDNLEQVADKRSEDNQDVTELRAQISEFRETLTQAIKQANDGVILEVQGQIEELTLGKDPLYLEGEEDRKRQYLEQKKKDAIHRPSWSQNPSRRFISLMKGDFHGSEEVTEAEQMTCISRCAWGFAILGLIVAISFLVVDFWSAQVNPALSTNLFHNEELEMPTIFGCMTFPMIPTFEQLPNANYNGNPLWGLRSYSNHDTGDTYLYPQTRELITESAVLGPKDVCEPALRVMSLQAIIAGLDSVFDPAARCYSCLRIGQKRPISLSYEKALSRPSGAVTLEFATSRDITFCFNPVHAQSSTIRESIQDLLKTHGDRLVKQNIVEITPNENPNIDIQYALNFGFEAYSIATPEDVRPRRAAEATVFCNLYLFSGYFFPVKPGTEVRYRYDVKGGLQSWIPIGNPSNFLTIDPLQTITTSNAMNRSDVLNDIRKSSRATEFGAIESGMHIYVLDSNVRAQPAFKDFAASLRPNHRDLLLFTKKIDGGVSRYSTRLQYGARKQFRAMGRFRRYNISLDFATFETETVTRRPTTSVAEFFTDIFEYIGLFTGVCAYSILVGPARMYLRRSKSSRQRN